MSCESAQPGLDLHSPESESGMLTASSHTLIQDVMDCSFTPHNFTQNSCVGNLKLDPRVSIRQSCTEYIYFITFNMAITKSLGGGLLDQ